MPAVIPRVKPASLMVFFGDKSELFVEIRNILRQILPIDTYTIAALSKRALVEHPWIQYCTCLLIADTASIDSIACARFNDYFLQNSSKILFFADNLSSAMSNAQEECLFSNVFGKESLLASITGKQKFRLFVKEHLELLSNNKEITTKDVSFSYNNLQNESSVIKINLSKKTGQPMCMQIQEPTQNRKMLCINNSIQSMLKPVFNEDGYTLPIQYLLSELGVNVVINKNGNELISQQPQFTSGYLFADTEKRIFNLTGMTYGKELGLQPKLLFQKSQRIVRPDEKNNNCDNKQIFKEAATAELLPVKICRSRDDLPTEYKRKFDVDKYYEKLQTINFGQILLFVPVCTSTMDVSESIANAFPMVDGTLIVTGHQTAGRGRIGNEWLCAEGAAMFNINLNVVFSSKLGRSICLLQHLIAVSICHAISQLAPDFPIRIKWPNDLYYGRLSKICGFLVRTSQNETEQKYSCLIGVGLNVSNSKPTLCINDMLPVGAKKLSIEELLALIINIFENQLNIFQSDGAESLMRDYYKFWLHSNEEVSILRTENGKHEKAVIRGLDADGYLLVRSKESGKLISLISDGNSFDLFQGLITPKSM